MYPVKGKYPLKGSASTTTGTIYPVKNPGKLNPCSPAPASYSPSGKQACAYYSRNNASHITSPSATGLGTCDAVAKVACNGHHGSSTDNLRQNSSSTVALKSSSYSPARTQKQSYRSHNNIHQVSPSSVASLSNGNSRTKVTLENQHGDKDRHDNKRQKIEVSSSTLVKLDGASPHSKIAIQPTPRELSQGDPANPLYVPGLILHLPPRSIEHNHNDLMILFESCARSKIHMSMDTSAIGAGTNQWRAKLSIQGKYLLTGHGQGPSKSRNDAATKALDMLCKVQPGKYKNIDEMMFKYPEKIAGLTLYKGNSVATKDECLNVLMDSCIKCNIPIKWWDDESGQVFGTGCGTVLVIGGKPICWGVGETVADSMKETAVKALEHLRNQPFIVNKKEGNGQNKEQPIKGTGTPDSSALKRKHSSGGIHKAITESTRQTSSATKSTAKSPNFRGSKKNVPLEINSPEKRQKVDDLHLPSGNPVFSVPRLTLYLPLNAEKQEKLENPMLILLESCFKSNISVKVQCPKPKKSVSRDAKLHIEDEQSEIGLTSAGNGKDGKSARNNAAQKALRILRKCQPYIYKKEEELFLQDNVHVKNLILHLKDSQDGSKVTNLSQLLESCEKCDLPVTWWDDGGGSTFGSTWTTVLLIDSKPICLGYGATVDEAKNDAASTAIGRLKKTQPIILAREKEKGITTKGELKSIKDSLKKAESVEEKNLKSGEEEKSKVAQSGEEEKSKVAQSGEEEKSKLERSGEEENLKLAKAGEEEKLKLAKSGEEEKLNLAKSGEEEKLNLAKSGEEEKLKLAKSGEEEKLKLAKSGKEEKLKLAKSGEEEKSKLAKSGEEEKSKLERSGEEEKLKLAKSGEEEKMKLAKSGEEEKSKLARSGEEEKSKLARSGEEEKSKLARSGEEEKSKLAKSGEEDILKLAMCGEEERSKEAKPEEEDKLKNNKSGQEAGTNEKSVEDQNLKNDKSAEDQCLNTNQSGEEPLKYDSSGKENKLTKAIPGLKIYVPLNSGNDKQESAEIAKSTLLRSVARCNIKLSLQDVESNSTMPEEKHYASGFSTNLHIDDILVACGHGKTQLLSRKNAWEVALDVLMQTQEVVCESKKSIFSKKNCQSSTINTDAVPETRIIAVTGQEVDNSCKKSIVTSLGETVTNSTQSTHSSIMNTTSVPTSNMTEGSEVAINPSTNGTLSSAELKKVPPKKKTYKIRSKWIDRTATASELKVDEKSEELIEMYLDLFKVR